MIERYVIDLNKFSDGDLILFFRSFSECCQEHLAFRDGAPACVPGPSHYLELADSLTRAVTAGLQDKQNEEERQAIRDKAVRSITFTTQYIVMFSDHHNDPSLLSDLGGVELQRRKRDKKAHQTLPPMPSRIQLKDLPEPGAIHISVSNRPNKGSVEVQVNEVSPTDEASWKRLGNFYACRFPAKGLDSVKKYYVRVRFDTTIGPGPWSEIQTIVVS